MKLTVLTGFSNKILRKPLHSVRLYKQKSMAWERLFSNAASFKLPRCDGRSWLSF